MADTASHVDTLIEHLTRRGNLPIPTLVDVLGHDGLETAGTVSVCAPDRPNTLLWAGMSDAAADVITALVVDPRTTITPLGATEAFLVFSYEGASMLALPVAQKPHRARDYAEPHWIPVVIGRFSALAEETQR